MRTLFYILVLATLVMSSCATSGIVREYDDLYYSPSKKEVVQTTESSIMYQDSLGIKRVTSHEIRQMRKNGVIDSEFWIGGKGSLNVINKSLANELYDKKYMIYYLSNKIILRNSETISLMRGNDEALKLMEDAQTKIRRLNEADLSLTVLLLGYVSIGSIVIYKNGIVTEKEFPLDIPEPVTDKELGILLGGITAIGIISGIIFASLRAESYKKANTAVELYNNGLKISSKLPNKELKFGFTGNGIGIRVNF